MNFVNYQKVMDQITAHPESWEQQIWHCGSRHCFAGHAQILADKPPYIQNIWEDAREFLGATRNEAFYLFDPERTLDDFKAFQNMPADERRLMVAKFAREG